MRETSYASVGFVYISFLNALIDPVTGSTQYFAGDSDVEMTP